MKFISKRNYIIAGVVCLILLIAVLFYFYPIPDVIKEQYNNENKEFYKAKIARCIYKGGIGFLIMPGYPDASGLFLNNKGEMICYGGILPGQQKTVDCTEVCCFKRLCLPINYK